MVAVGQTILAPHLRPQIVPRINIVPAVLVRAVNVLLIIIVVRALAPMVARLVWFTLVVQMAVLFRPGIQTLRVVLLPQITPVQMLDMVIVMSTHKN